MSDLFVERQAEISADGRHRYFLSIIWDKMKPVLVFVMLNPSRADKFVDDPTIRVCCGRAKRMDCGGIIVMNAFAFRTPYPAEMMSVPDRVGPLNDEWLMKVASYNPRMIIVAWGDGGLLIGHSKSRYREVVDILCRQLQCELYCLGTTAAGQPRHPLRRPYKFVPVRWAA